MKALYIYIQDLHYTVEGLYRHKSASLRLEGLNIGLLQSKGGIFMSI